MTRATFRSAGNSRLALLPLLALLAGSASAGGTLTNCTYESLSAALIGGGLVKFECEGTITVPDTLVISVSTALDATGRSVTLAGSSTNKPLISVEPFVELSLTHLTLSGAQNARGAALHNEGSVALRDCTLTGNTASEGLGGAIYNARGSVWASGCAFKENKANGTAGADGAAGDTDEGMGEPGEKGGAGLPGYGGAIYNAPLGAVTLTNCVFQSNAALGGPGGKGGDGGSGGFQGGDGGHGGTPGAAFGGAIYNAGTLDLRDCTLLGNAATGGAGGPGGSAGAGAWSAAQGSGANGADASGGAIFNAGTLTLLSSTLSTNTVTGGIGEAGGVDGGGEGLNGAPGGTARGGALANIGTASILNCTLVTNVAAGGAAGAGGPGGLIGGNGGRGGSAWGGGIYSSNLLAMTNCTVATNGVVAGARGEAGEGSSNGNPGKPGTAHGANLAAETQPLLLRNTLLAGPAGLENAFGTLQDEGHNLSSDATPPFAAGKQSTNAVDALLGQLGAYGGPTQTLPLKTGSPAVDAGAADAAVTSDQRGVPRGTAPDIGAFERQPCRISGRVSTTRTDIAIPVHLVSLTGTNLVLTSGDGSFLFNAVKPGPQRLELPAPTNAAYAPAQYYVFVTEFSEGQSNLVFYPRQAELAVGTNAAGQFRLVGVGPPSATVHVQATTNLVTAGSTWVLLSTNKTDANGAFEFVQTNASQFRRRFYRTLQP